MSIIGNPVIAAGGGGGSGGSKPKLNAPTIALSTYALTITNPATNGNFVTGYKILVDGAETYTTQNTSYDLSSLAANTATITVKAVGTDFEDSAASNSKAFYRYYTVEMYDDDKTTLLSSASVRYGSMPSYVPSKTGYGFVAWEYADGSPVTAITSAAPIYATYTTTFVIDAGVYATRSTMTDKDAALDMDINFTWRRIGGTSGVPMTGTGLYRYSSGSTPMIYCSRTTSSENRMMPFATNSAYGIKMWLPQNFMYAESGDYRITVTADTNVTQEQKSQFEYFFRKLSS